MPKIDMDKLISSDCWFEFGMNLEKKNPNFTNALLVQHKTHLQIEITLTHTANMQANNTNENKQFWPRYKVINVTNISNISFLLKKLLISYISLIN